MRDSTTPRTWIWAALIVQIAGLAFDAVWHGFLNPGFEAVTVGQMITHLSTVHLPIYIGVLSVFVSTGWALIDEARRSTISTALTVAFAGALVSMAGEAWHAYTHLQLTTHSGPRAATMAFLGLMVVVSALWFERRHARRRAAGDIAERRA